MSWSWNVLYHMYFSSTSWSITVGIALVVTIHVFLLLFAFSFPLAPFLLFTWSSLRWARPIKRKYAKCFSFQDTKIWLTSCLTLNQCRQHLWVGRKRTQEATSEAAGPASPPVSSRAGRSQTLASWRGNSCGTSSSSRPRKIGRCCTGRCSRRPASPWSRPRRSGLWSSPSIGGSWDQRSPWGAIIEKGFLDPEWLPEGHRFWPQLVHLEKKPSTKLEIPFWQVASALPHFGWQLKIEKWYPMNILRINWLYRKNLINGGAQ